MHGGSAWRIQGTLLVLVVQFSLIYLRNGLANRFHKTKWAVLELSAPHFQRMLATVLKSSYPCVAATARLKHELYWLSTIGSGYRWGLLMFCGPSFASSCVLYMFASSTQIHAPCRSVSLQRCEHCVTDM